MVETATIGRKALGLSSNHELQATRQPGKAIKKRQSAVKGRPVVQVQVRGLTCQATREGGSLLITLCFDPDTGDETNLTSILDYLVQRT